MSHQGVRAMKVMREHAGSARTSVTGWNLGTAASGIVRETILARSERKQIVERHQIATHRSIPGILGLSVGLLAALGIVEPARSGPNLMAIGNYNEMPFKRAGGRDSLTGKEIIFEFEEPGLDFGRVVIRSNQPSSVIRRDLFVGFTGAGLTIDTALGRSGERGGGSLQIQEVEIWLRIKGKMRPGKSYEWEFETPERDFRDHPGHVDSRRTNWRGGDHS
jgi:hypothetical protein